MPPLPADMARGRRFVSEVWEARSPEERVPESILEATGLPPRPYGVFPTGDSAIAILDLFEPRVFSRDSILVHLEWIFFDAAEHSSWGADYDFHLRCRGACEVVHRYGPGHLDLDWTRDPG